MDWERELAQILERERTLISELADCSKQKTDMLASGDLDRLSKMLNKEQPLTLQCQAIESQRLSILKKYKLDGKTLKEICQMADKENKELLETKLEELNDVIKEFKKTNALNKELTKSRLEFYGKMKALFTKPVYGYNGSISQKSNEGASLIDRKI